MELRLYYCDRCHCSVPLDEFRVTKGAEALVHTGPMRDHAIDQFVGLDELGNIDCGFVQSIHAEGQS